MRALRRRLAGLPARRDGVVGYADDPKTRRWHDQQREERAMNEFREMVAAGQIIKPVADIFRPDGWTESPSPGVVRTWSAKDARWHYGIDLAGVPDFLGESDSDGLETFEISVPDGSEVDLVTEHVCRVCGCTDDSACAPEPCSWYEIDLCSTCAASTPAELRTFLEIRQMHSCLDALDDDRHLGWLWAAAWLMVGLTLGLIIAAVWL